MSRHHAWRPCTSRNFRKRIRTRVVVRQSARYRQHGVPQISQLGSWGRAGCALLRTKVAQEPVKTFPVRLTAFLALSARRFCSRQYGPASISAIRAVGANPQSGASNLWRDLSGGRIFRICRPIERRRRIPELLLYYNDLRFVGFFAIVATGLQGRPAIPPQDGAAPLCANDFRNLPACRQVLVEAADSSLRHSHYHKTKRGPLPASPRVCTRAPIISTGSGCGSSPCGEWQIEFAPFPLPVAARFPGSASPVRPARGLPALRAVSAGTRPSRSPPNARACHPPGWPRSPKEEDPAPSAPGLVGRVGPAGPTS